MEAIILNRNIVALLIGLSGMVFAQFASSIAAGKDRLEDTAPIVAGWIENIYLSGAKTPIQAKMDTGARTSSLHAPGYHRFIRDNTNWLRFTVRTDKGEEIAIEQPIVRIAHIRRARVGMVERPVIKLEICLGGHRKVTEFTLTDRSNMKYAVLIGRAFLADLILVNASKTFLTTNSCLR